MTLIPLRDLLQPALLRANVSKSVTAAQIVNSATDIIINLLPEKYSSEAKATTFKDSILTITCAHSSVAQFLADSENSILDYVKNSYPEQKIALVKYKIAKIL